MNFAQKVFLIGGFYFISISSTFFSLMISIFLLFSSFSKIWIHFVTKSFVLISTLNFFKYKIKFGNLIALAQVPSFPFEDSLIRGLNPT